MEETSRDGLLIGLGNPLLDISALVNEAFLNKYHLKPDNAILAGEEHIQLYDDLVKNFDVEYIAGGSTQNSLRAAQWVLQRPNLCVFYGCVGNDKNSKILYENAIKDGVKVMYQYTNARPTGTCAVLLTKAGKNRSLVANLAASECFSKDHLEEKENRKIINQAEFYYSSGFFLTVNIDAIMDLAQLAHKRNKMFAMNLSAEFLPIHYKREMMQVYPYVDIMFGNKCEMMAFATANNFVETDIKEIAKKMSSMPKQNPDRQRLIIVTQGTDPVLFFDGNNVIEYEVEKIPQEKVVDTNGAGDAFVGGFFSQLIKGEPYATCIKCGIWLSGKVVGVSGTKFIGEVDFLP